MDDFYGLPLALVMEELLKWEKPKGRGQTEQRPETAKEDRESKGTAEK